MSVSQLDVGGSDQEWKEGAFIMIRSICYTVGRRKKGVDPILKASEGWGWEKKIEGWTEENIDWHRFFLVNL